jgi:DNA-binding NtrC family response regulator
MKVLIVDDDATTLSVLEATLEQEGYEVVSRSEALGTMQTVSREKPDVAVIDVRMPGLGGDRLAQLIAQSHPSLTVVLHSSLPAKDLAQMVRTSGAAGFIEKRGDPSDFVRTLTRLVESRSTGRAAAPAARKR